MCLPDVIPVATAARCCRWLGAIAYTDIVCRYSEALLHLYLDNLHCGSYIILFHIFFCLFFLLICHFLTVHDIDATLLRLQYAAAHEVVYQC